jgi:hypothetical protein
MLPSEIPQTPVRSANCANDRARRAGLPRRAVRKTIPAWFVILPFIVALGCNDPYSQRRIERRWAHFDQTATDIADRERDGVRRVREADETLKKWWERDVEDWERRAPTIGDYFW